MQKIIFEIGANSGTDTANFLIDSNSIVYAFEPTPELHLHLKEVFKTEANYRPIPLAVDLENSWKIFNIAGSHDWGCSSIHDFNPNIHELWEGRPDFAVTDKCWAMTIRLDTFMKIYDIPRIDYLWIDAQGNDFRVLQSLGERINDVVAGKCEAAASVNLYHNVDNSKDSIVSWLEKNGFTTSITDHLSTSIGKEVDIHFHRK